MDNENIIKEPDIAELLRNGKVEITTNSTVIAYLIKNKDDRITGLNTNIACINCPKNNWEVTGKTLANYCQQKHVFTWTTATPGDIQLCDQTSRFE